MATEYYFGSAEQLAAIQDARTDNEVIKATDQLLHLRSLGEAKIIGREHWLPDFNQADTSTISRAQATLQAFSSGDLVIIDHGKQEIGIRAQPRY